MFAAIASPAAAGRPAEPTLRPASAVGYKAPSTAAARSMGQFLFFVIDGLLGLLEVAIIVWAVIGWLIAFNVMNDRHPLIRQIESFLDAVVRPVLAPIRRIVPNLGAVDISPIIALLILQGVRAYLLPWLFRPIIVALGG